MKILSYAFALAIALFVSSFAFTATPAAAQNNCSTYYDSQGGNSGVSANCWNLRSNSNVNSRDYRDDERDGYYGRRRDRDEQQNDVVCTTHLFSSHCESHPRVVCYDGDGKPFTVDRDGMGHEVPGAEGMRRAPGNVNTNCGPNNFSAGGDNEPSGK